MIYNKLVLFVALLLSCKIGFSQEIHATNEMVLESLTILQNESIELTKPEVAYHLGVVYGNLLSKSNPQAVNLETFDKIDANNSYVFSKAFKKIDVTDMPDSILAIKTIDGDHSQLTDEKFCLYKGIVVGEVLAGTKSNNAVYAGMAGVERMMKKCTPTSRRLKEEAENRIYNGDREISKEIKETQKPHLAKPKIINE